MAGYIGAKQGVTQVDGYNRSEADAEFVNDPNDVITVSGSNVGIGASSPAYELEVRDNAGSSFVSVISNTVNEAGIIFGDTDAAARGGVVYDNSTNYMAFRTNDNTERMRIDSAGRVTMPYQPAARASYSGSNIGPTNKIILNNVNMYRGGMSIDNTNNRINVPVSGWYKIGYHHLSAATSTQVAIRVNGVYIDGGYTQEVDTGNTNFSVQIIHNLSAGDYIEFWVIGGAVHGNPSYNMMYAHLLG